MEKAKEVQEAEEVQWTFRSGDHSLQGIIHFEKLNHASPGFPCERMCGAEHRGRGQKGGMAER